MKSRACEITAEFSLSVTGRVLPMYDNFSKAAFDAIPFGIKSVVDIVYAKHGQSYIECMEVDLNCRKVKSGNDVVVCYSGGLDSLFQAITLKDNGYNVHLLHVKGINTYENGNSAIAAREAAEYMGIDYHEVKIKKVRDGEYKQAFPENPVKNQLIAAIAVDLCLCNGWSNISLGDDKTRLLDNVVLGVNLTDAKELGDAFEAAMNEATGITFLSIDDTITKPYRLEKVYSRGTANHYYSCVAAGRFNQYYHTKQEEKYGVKLAKYNCGSMCRKCALHNLIAYYYLCQDFPKEFVDACWKRLWDNSYSVNDDLFAKHIPLEERIKNLAKPLGD